MLAKSDTVAFDMTPTQNAHRTRGIGRYVAGLAAALARQTDVPIEFWGWASEKAFNPPPPHTTLWLPRRGLPRARASWFFAKLAIRRFAHRSSARVVHITDPNGLILLGGRRTLTTAYDLIPMLEGDAHSGVIERWDYGQYLRRLRSVDQIFAISNQTATDLVEYAHIPRSAIVVAIPGVDFGAKPAAAANPAAPYFLYIGSPEPHKNVPVLLEALALAPDIHERLLIAGTWYPQHVKTLLEEADRLPGMRDRITFVGFIPDSDLGTLLASATALVVPSKREGFGLPVAEGLAAGVVIIHSRIPVLEEVSDGAALTFDPGSPSELASCLRRVSTDPALRVEFQRRGLLRSKALSWDGALAATLTAYREVLAGGS